jgi:hypothetical protein
MWSLGGSGCESLVGVRCTGFVDGDCLWDLSLGQHTGDGKFDGKSFWVGCGWFFSWGGSGEGKRNSRSSTAEAFSQDDTSSKEYFLYYILYIDQWGFHCSMPSNYCEGTPRSTRPWTDTCDVQVSTT